uniref:Uncharacterized protein n=1 Tax=Glossina brevipalpis TaxID=37001 RepID=A0A1A9X4H3_9MUSC
MSEDSEDLDFTYNEFNLDFLQTIPKDAPPKKCENLLKESEFILKKFNNCKAGKKRAELAKKIHDADALITQIQQLKKDKQQIEQQLNDFQATANEIQELYAKEKEKHRITSRNLQELQEKCDILDNELTNQKFDYDQLQALCEKGKGRPLEYDDLAVKYLKMIQRFEESQGSLKGQDSHTIVDLKRYCSNRNIKIPASCSPKKARPKLKIKKQEKSTQCEPWQQEYSKSHSVESKDQAVQCQAQMRTQGTQHISTMTTRGTSTSCFIQQRHVGTSFPDPKLQPSVEEILSEFGKWDITPISPFIDSQTEVEKKSYKTIGTCTWLCNIRRQIDYLSTRIARPHTQQLDKAIKEEVSTPAASPTPTNVRNIHASQTPLESNLPSANNAEQFSTNTTAHHESFRKPGLEQLNITTFDELWQVFGKMIFSLIQSRNATMPSTFPNANLNLINSMQVPTFNQQEFHNWLRELYENTRRNWGETNKSRKVSEATTTENGSQTLEEEVKTQEKIAHGLLKFKSSIRDREQLIKPQARCNYQKNSDNLTDTSTTEITKASYLRNIEEETEETSSLHFSSATSKPLDELFNADSNSTTDEEISRLNLTVEKAQPSVLSNIRDNVPIFNHKSKSLTEKILELFPEVKLGKNDHKTLKKLLKKSQKPKKNKTIKKPNTTAALPSELNAVDFLANLPNFAFTSAEKSTKEYDVVSNVSPKPKQDDFVFIKPSNKIRRKASNKRLTELFGEDMEIESDEETDASNKKNNKELKRMDCKGMKSFRENKSNIQEKNNLQYCQNMDQNSSTSMFNHIRRVVDSRESQNYKDHEESSRELKANASEFTRTNGADLPLSSTESTFLDDLFNFSSDENLSLNVDTMVSKMNEAEGEKRQETSIANNNHNITSESLGQQISTKNLEENQCFARFSNENSTIQTFPNKSLNFSKDDISYHGRNDQCEETEDAGKMQQPLANGHAKNESPNSERKEVKVFNDSQDFSSIRLSRIVEEDLEISSEDEDDILTNPSSTSLIHYAESLINEKSEQPLADNNICTNFKAILDENLELNTIRKTEEKISNMLREDFEMSSSDEDCEAKTIENELNETLIQTSDLSELVSSVTDISLIQNERNFNKKRQIEGKNQSVELSSMNNYIGVNEYEKHFSKFDASITTSLSSNADVVGDLRESPESSNVNTFSDNELIIDEECEEPVERNKSESDSNGTSSSTEDLTSTSMLPFLDATTCQEILTDSVCNIVNDILNDTCLEGVGKSALINSEKSKRKARKRKSDLEPEAIIPRKCSARLQAKRLTLESTLNLSSIPVELGKYTRPIKQLNNFCKPMSTRGVKHESVDLCKNEEIPLQIGFFMEREEEIITKVSSKEEEIITKDSSGEEDRVGGSTLLLANVSDVSVNTSKETLKGTNDFKEAEKAQNTKATSFYITKDSTNFTSISPLDAAFCESPQSPPPFDSSDIYPSAIPIPLELSTNLLRQKPNNSLFDRLIDSYDQKHFNNIISKSKKKMGKTPDQKIISHLEEYCLSNRFTDSNVCELIRRLKTTTSDYKTIYGAVIQVAKESSASGVPEKDLPSVIQEMPPRHLSQSLQGIAVVLRHFFYENPDFCNDLMAEIDAQLFNCQQTPKISLKGSLNITQLYLLTVSLQKNHLEKHPARLFIANCIYYYDRKAIPMIHEVLMWYPTALPPREDRTYDRSDALITVIQHILMNTSYDMNNTDLRGKSLISKLRYEYHFTPYTPNRNQVIENLIGKLKQNKLHDIDLTFSMLAKRMPSAEVEKHILTQLLPLADEFYNFLSKSKEYDSRVTILLDIISKIIKPFPVQTDVQVYLDLFARFLNVIERPAIQEAALNAIIRLQRFSYINCYNLLKHYNPTHKLSTCTEAMLKTFLYRKPLKFWKIARFQNKS